jgi:hypothetical protein
MVTAAVYKISAFYSALKLYNEALHNLYPLPTIIIIIQVKEDEMGRPYGRHGRE